MDNCSYCGEGPAVSRDGACADCVRESSSALNFRINTCMSCGDELQRVIGDSWACPECDGDMFDAVRSVP